MARILLLDDEPNTLRVIALHLERNGYEVVSGKDGREGLERIARERFDLILTDLRMPFVSGMDLLKTLRQQGLQIPVIVLTAYASIESAVEAMKLGAADYIGKPPQLDEITIKVKNALEQQALLEENRRLRDALAERFGFDNIVGRSPAIGRLLEKVRILARDSNITVLLTGESGTGKELIARSLHYNSPRNRCPFLAINCGALPENLLESELFGHEKGAFTGAGSEKKGLIEAAQRGTLFLDEIGEMPQVMQVKLLRALEEKEVRRLGGTRGVPVDVRILSSTNQDLEQMLERKTFRKDLYYRLAVATLELPPLREREGDVPLLVSHFLARFNREKGKSAALDPEAMAFLEAYPWPGNVRELEHLIEMLVVTAPSNLLTEQHLPEKYKRAFALQPGAGEQGTGSNLASATHRLVGEFERGFILRHLEENHWNVTQTAREIGISRAALHMKMKEYGLHNA